MSKLDPKETQAAFLAELCKKVNVNPETLAQIEELCLPPVTRQFANRNVLLKEIASVRVANLMAERSVQYFQAVEEAFSEDKIRKVAEELFKENGKKIVMELAAMEEWGGNLQLKSYERFSSTSLYKRISSQFEPVLEEALIPILKKGLEKIKCQDHTRLESDLIRFYHQQLKERLNSLIQKKAEDDARFLFELMKVDTDAIRNNAAAIARLKAKDAPEADNVIPE